MKKSSFFVLIGFLAVLCMPVSYALADDVFSVNFYMKPWPWPEGDVQHILLEDADQPAGFGDWLTDGWQDMEIPWAPTAPQEPVTITSKGGLTATYTLETARNGGAYFWPQIRTTLIGDGNADLMDGHANGTEDEDELIELTVSDIPFNNYDVVFYLGSQEAQFGDGTGKIVFNGVEHGFTLISGVFDGTFAEIVDAGTPGNYILFKGLKEASFTVMTRGNGFNHIGPCGFQIRKASPESASSPTPEDAQTDLWRDSDLSWTPGQFAATHNVYVGESLEEVEGATMLTVSGLDVNSVDPGRLEFGQTYFWRVDEVNGTADKTVFKGSVWSFDVEPYSMPIAGSEIIATASSSANEMSLPEKTLDGSGLGEDSTHDMKAESMWFSAMGDMEPWIQFEFEGVKKLDIMTVWNSNTAAEGFIGYGVMGVEIAYSEDGETWSVFEDVNEFSRAPGSPAYNQYDEIDLGGLAAKMVRLNIQSNFGGFMQSYSLSEVQFSMIPAAAREPVPEPGSVDISPDAVLSWRAGRGAAQSTVYLGTDPNEVADGLVASVTSDTGSVDLSAFDAEMGQTYYWSVDEVNEAEVTSVWAGPVWSFSTVDALIVEDFENYTNHSPDRPFQVWLDGFGYSADEFFPAGYGGNGTGAGIGHDIWTITSPYYNGSIMETARTIAGSSQSMPFYYVNSGNVVAETTRTFAPAQDWTVGGAQLLSIAFFGEADNTGTLYVKINGSKVTYPLEPLHIAAQTWKTWNIDLSDLGINPQSITNMAIGVDGNGASGMLLIDDITLRQAPSPDSETVSLINNFDLLPVGSNMHDVPGWEGWFGDAQWAAKVTDIVAYSGTNSLEIMGTRDDVVPNWPMVQNGVYVASVMQYVPTGTDGLMHFGPLSSYGTSWDDTAWLGTLLSNCTTGLVYVNELTAGSRTEAPLLRNQWVEVRIVMNFDGNACDFYYGDTFLGSLECPSAMGFDIWPDDDVDVLYYDDFRFQSEAGYLRGMPGNVPNGDFETLYKPGTEITGVVAGGAWSMGVGLDCPIDGGTGYEFSDETTGVDADIPGWIGYDQAGWIANGGTYERDTTNVNFQGNISFVDGTQFFGANGGGWGNSAGGLITSAASLGIVGDSTYVLSMTARAPDGAATPVVLDLLADGVVLTPTSSVDPVLTGEWQEVSRTYEAASLAGVLGQDLTIVLGVGRGSSGGQSHLDDVSLYIR